MGFALNAYFGFPVNQYLFSYLNTNFHLGLPPNGTFLDPLSPKGLKTLLLYSGYIGLFMVSFGLVLGMLNAYWMHERKHMVGKFGWLLTGWGIALSGLALLHHGNINVLANPVSRPLIIGMHRRDRAHNLRGGSAADHRAPLDRQQHHLIHETARHTPGLVRPRVPDRQPGRRPDTSATPGLLYGGIPLAIVGVVLFVMVHVFNLVLGILEPGIQGARLLYVETFSKFLHGGGRPFSPFKGPRTYTLSETEIAEPKN